MALPDFLKNALFSSAFIHSTQLVDCKLFAGIAQLVEQLICNQQVVGSSPSAGFLFKACIQSGFAGD